LPTETGMPTGFSVAQPTAALLEFLKANGQTIPVDSATCAPGGIAFGESAATSPASTASPPAPLRPPG
jgi:hypothetical protein